MPRQLPASKEFVEIMDLATGTTAEQRRRMLDERLDENILREAASPCRKYSPLTVNEPLLPITEPSE